MVETRVDIGPFQGGSASGIGKYECLSIYKLVRDARISNSSRIQQNNAVARSVKAGSSLQCQNAIVVPGRSATLCKYK